MVFLSGPWPWYVAGPIIGLFVPALLIFGNKMFGVSSNLRHMCSAVLPGRLEFFRYIRFIVEEAARAGVKVAAHVQTERGARAAIEAGVASIEHGWVLTDEDLALAKKNNVVLVSTDFTIASLLANGMELPAARRTHERYVARLKRAWAAGVDVVFGTDVMSDIKGRTRGELAIEYIESFVEAGIGAPDILRAMTSRAAALLGTDKERGAIRAGMAADLVATPTNPLRNIEGLKEINFVMKDGKIWRRPQPR